jgi:hypothetical protein
MLSLARRAKIPLVVVSLLNNPILSSLSTICTHPLLQAAPATHYQAAAAPHSRDGSLAPTTPRPHLIPFPCHPEIPSFQRSPHPPKLIAPPHHPAPAPALAPAPVAQPAPLEEVLPSGWELRYDPRGRAHYVDHTTRSNAWTRSPLSVPIRPTSPPPALPGRSYFRTQPTQTAPTPTCACPSDGRSAARPAAVRISLTLTRARQRGTTLLGLSGDDDCAGELCCAKSAAIGIGGCT